MAWASALELSTEAPIRPKAICDSAAVACITAAEAFEQAAQKIDPDPPAGAISAGVSNMRDEHRLCYDSLILEATADPRGAAVALHDEAVRKRHTVFESYESTMPPSIARLGVNNQKRKKWQSETKWRLHQAHLHEQEQRAAAAAAAAQEEEAAVAAAAEDAMDTSGEDGESAV